LSLVLYLGLRLISWNVNQRAILFRAASFQVGKHGIAFRFAVRLHELIQAQATVNALKLMQAGDAIHQIVELDNLGLRPMRFLFHGFDTPLRCGLLGTHILGLHGVCHAGFA